MIENIFNIISIIISLLLTTHVIFNLVLARNNRDKNKLKNARIQIIILLIVYVIYGMIRNMI